jgi:hypothetical protein
MIRLARGFLRRPASDRWLLVRALALHACVASLLRVVRFGRLSRWLGGASLQAVDEDRPLDSAATERIVWAVRQATAVAPWGRTCLTEALTAVVLLRRSGCRGAELRYGVAPGGSGFVAHAWLEYRGAVILGTSVRPYAVLHGAGRTA